MILFAGALLLALGLVCGLFLLLAPFGIGPATPGVITWILFPGFTVVGYILLAVAARIPHVALASRIAGACLVLLAVGAAVALFAIGNALVKSSGDAAGLWYVMGLGLTLGATGFAIGRVSAGTEPAQS
jgi:hypothetical protein